MKVLNYENIYFNFIRFVIVSLFSYILICHRFFIMEDSGVIQVNRYVMEK